MIRRGSDLPLQLVASEEEAGFYYSVMMSSGAAAQVLSATGCGFLARRITMRRVFLLLQVIAIFGSLLYAMAAVPFHSVWGIIIGRCIACLGTGSYSLSGTFCLLIVMDIKPTWASHYPMFRVSSQTATKGEPSSPTFERSPSLPLSPLLVRIRIELSVLLHLSLWAKWLD